MKKIMKMGTDKQKVNHMVNAFANGDVEIDEMKYFILHLNDNKLEDLAEKLIAAEKAYGGDFEAVHSKQDDFLLEYIDNEEITKMFNRTPKHCA